MGCNAFNHPPGCKCGWGGDTGGGFSATGINHWIPSWSSKTAEYRSYTNPNASCPVCGASVFYYESHHGGRVFFDELGPPWPKHPCTDNQNSNKFRPNSRPQIFTPHKQAHWDSLGWEPIRIIKVEKDHLTTKLICVRLKTNKHLTLGFKGNVVFGSSPVHIKQRSKDASIFDVSLLRSPPFSSKSKPTSPEPIVVLGYTGFTNAKEYEDFRARSGADEQGSTEVQNNYLKNERNSEPQLNLMDAVKSLPKDQDLSTEQKDFIKDVVFSQYIQGLRPQPPKAWEREIAAEKSIYDWLSKRTDLSEFYKITMAAAENERAIFLRICILYGERMTLTNEFPRPASGEIKREVALCGGNLGWVFRDEYGAAEFRARLGKRAEHFKKLLKLSRARASYFALCKKAAESGLLTGSTPAPFKVLKKEVLSNGGNLRWIANNEEFKHVFIKNGLFQLLQRRQGVK